MLLISVVVSLSLLKGAESNKPILQWSHGFAALVEVSRSASSIKPSSTSPGMLQKSLLARRDDSTYFLALSGTNIRITDERSQMKIFKKSRAKDRFSHKLFF
ncbi:hypothetical protein AMECASPLE_021043 [Ameca splendens]|uniref:Uncharacterized protein n=1 Tax=Ameca splendens TaxID=208324 RepID=A0ABV0Y3Z2_9TELE